MTVTKSIGQPSKRTSEEAEPPLRKVGAYDVFAPLAQGGGGSVWLAFDRKSPALVRVVAIKFLHREGGSDDAQKRRFLREARIGSSIRHTNVVEVLDAGEQDGQPYLVMPYIEGVDVRALARTGLLPVDVAVSIVADALRGLEAAHEARTFDGKPSGVVHRNLSPHNLLVGVDGSTKLTDFGIARPLEGPDRSVTGWAQGKVAYFSPEQSRGEPLDRRSDVFSAGIVLWELLVGRTLFAHDDPFITAHRVQTQRVPAPSSERPEIPPSIDEVTLTALARDPEGRPATAAAMLSALMHAAAEAGIVPLPERVVTYVRAHASAVLAERAEVLRFAAAGLDLPEAGATGSRSASRSRGALPDGPALVAPRRGRRALRPLLAALVFALLGGAALLGLVSTSKTTDERRSEPAEAAALARALTIGVASSMPDAALPSISNAGAPEGRAPAPASAPASNASPASPVRDRRRSSPAPSAPKLPISANPF